MLAKPKRILQAGAIPVRNSKICLITSRSGKRWVIPKGCLEPGKTVSDIALQEAWEEAGLRGILQARPIGSFTYEKYGDAHHVTVFLMEVTSVAEDWPERRLRERRWLRPIQALARVEDPGLHEILRSVFCQPAPIEHG
jgi:8-oxo-dGTP pyrophosphatase MutT (NUDIX family)